MTSSGTRLATPHTGAILAVLFPGQGSQMVGMATEIAKNIPEAAAVFDLASETLGLDARKLCWGLDAFALRKTENAQPALVISSLACWQAFLARIDFPLAPTSVFAGHSLGSLTAAAAAGYLSTRDAIDLARERGRLMAAAPGEGAMLAVSVPEQKDFELQIRAASQLAQRYQLDVAALNGPRQVVLSGPTIQVRSAAASLGSMSKALDVSHAFHSKLMAPVAGEWADLLSSRTWLQGDHVYLPNGTMTATEDGAQVRRDLQEAIYSPVYWSRVLSQIPSDAHVVIPGSGKVIERLLRGVGSAKVSTVDSLRSLARAVAA